MARAALPQSKLRARRRKQRMRIGLAVFLLALVGVGGVLAIMHAPFWRIASVTVSGTQSVAPQSIEAYTKAYLTGSYFSVFPQDNIVLYPKRALTTALKKHFPALSSVKVSSAGLTAIKIEVSEFGSFALWCGESPNIPAGCLLLDKAGVAYAPAVSFSGSAYVQYYGELESSKLPRQYLGADKFAALVALLLQVGQTVGEPLEVVSVDKNNDVRASFASEFTLIFSLNDAGADVYQHFLLAQGAEPFKNKKLSDFEYLDLRFGDKLYYKLKGV